MTSQFAYQVRFSVRGEDTRSSMNFTDHLYTASVKAGFHTFKDDGEIVRGQDIGCEVMKGIRKSKISVVVFSEDYASSRWCLDELSYILRQRKNNEGHVVLPIFYRIHPSDVKKQTGTYAEAFVQHEERFETEMDKVEGWRATLREVAGLAGMVLTYQREAQFIEEIIKVIARMLKQRFLSIPAYPKGLNFRLEEISRCVPFFFECQVFLSFRGTDTRNNFTYHLYKALVKAGYHTFRDDDGIERGEGIASELEKAIRQSKLSIVVFSENYAFSRWCLDELVNILERRKKAAHMVVPIFYRIKPSDVRKQAGAFAEAFVRHEKRFKADKVEGWRAALREAANLTGMCLRNQANGYEALFIEDIIEEIAKLNPTLLSVPSIQLD